MSEFKFASSMMQEWEQSSNTMDVYNKGRKDERSKIIEILDSADDSKNAMYLLTKYLIEEQLKE